MIYQLEIYEWQVILWAAAVFLTVIMTIIYLLITGSGGSKDE